MEHTNFWKTNKGIGLILGLILAVALLTWGIYENWHIQQVKFHDVTVELGTESISIRDFMTEYARPGQVGFVSGVEDVDLNRVGQYLLTLRHGGQQQTVTLTVQDTTAPVVDLYEVCYLPIHTAADPMDLVERLQDESDTRVYLQHMPQVPEDYSDVTTTVVAEDRYGNRTAQTCTVSWLWMYQSCTLELGEKLTKADLLLDHEKDGESIDQAALDEINSADVGVYTLESKLGERTNTCTVTVQDTRGPELTVQDVKRNVGVSAAAEDFVTSAKDASGAVELRLVTEVDFDQKGRYTVVIEAEDPHGNITSKEATLYVATDSVAPVISGLKYMSVKKHSEPDFMEGVSAIDVLDGACAVTCDTGKLDLTESGTYYITYRSVDNSGNIATARRKVVVQHDWEDTKARVISIAKQLSNNPERIRDYVRSSIGYNHSWGGEDPVWSGFTSKVGNCYVHALCLKAIFDYKGIESRLIWVTNRSHYWLIVNIDGQWKHIDPTPGRTHSRYSLMSDTQRLKTLSGRVWDTTLWPECN